jgi:hypothetical protein
VPALRLATPRDLVSAVLRSARVDFPLRALHRVPREDRLGGLLIGWGTHHYQSELYAFSRDAVWIEGSPRALAALGVHALAQSVALEGGPPAEVVLADRAAEGRPCTAVRIFVPPGRRPLLRAPRWIRARVERRPWRAERAVDRPQLGLVRPEGTCATPAEYEKRTILTMAGTRGALRALAFLLFNLATDRTYQDAVELEGPEGFDNLAPPSCEARIASPYWIAGRGAL